MTMGNLLHQLTSFLVSQRRFFSVEVAYERVGLNMTFSANRRGVTRPDTVHRAVLQVLSPLLRQPQPQGHHLLLLVGIL